MKNKLSVDTQLVLLEQTLDAASQCLNDGDAQALTQASEALQTTAMGLLQMMQIFSGRLIFL